MMKKMALLAGISVAALITGCAHTLSPSPQRVNAGKVPQFSMNGKIKIINNQPSTAKQFIGKLAAHKYYGSLNKWTEAACKLLRKELKERGASIAEDSGRGLKLSVNKAVLDAGGGAWRKRCIVHLGVETGDGYKKQYVGTCISGGFESRAAGGGVTLALTEMLKDEKIVSYLKD